MHHIRQPACWALSVIAGRRKKKKKRKGKPSSSVNSIRDKLTNPPSRLHPGNSDVGQTTQNGKEGVVVVLNLVELEEQSHSDPETKKKKTWSRRKLPLRA